MIPYMTSVVKFLHLCFHFLFIVTGGPRVLKVQFVNLQTYPGWLETPLNATIFVSPAKQKRDICTAFPASSSSAA